MVKRLLLFSFSLYCTSLGFSQPQEETEADSTDARRTFIPSIYIDYGKLLTVPMEMETKYEGGVELLFLEKFPIILEVGSATLTPDQAFSNGDYESSGIYYRIGTGIYSQFQPKNKLGLTFRYGISSFDEANRITLQSPSGVQETTIETLNRQNLSASWIEAVIYSDRKFNDLLTLGINIRLRVLQDYDEQSPVDVYAIPGYGRSFDKSIPAANLFLKVSF